MGDPDQILPWLQLVSGSSPGKLEQPFVTCSTAASHQWHNCHRRRKRATGVGRILQVFILPMAKCFVVENTQEIALEGQLGGTTGSSSNCSAQ